MRDIFAFYLIFDQQYDMREIHDEENACHDNGEAKKVVAPHFLENIKRVVFLCFHEKHEVGIEEHIDKIDRNCHDRKKKKAPGKLLETGTNVSREGEHDGICGKENMYREAVDMHEIEKRQLCPRGKEECHKRARDANGIKEII